MAAGVPVNKKEIARYEELQVQSEKLISELSVQWEKEKECVEKIRKLHEEVFKSTDQPELSGAASKDLENLYTEFKKQYGQDTYGLSLRIH